MVAIKLKLVSNEPIKWLTPHLSSSHVLHCNFHAHFLPLNGYLQMVSFHFLENQIFTEKLCLCQNVSNNHQLHQGIQDCVP